MGATIEGFKDGPGTVSWEGAEVKARSWNPYELNRHENKTPRL